MNKQGWFEKYFLSGVFLFNKRVAVFLWFGLSSLTVIQSILLNKLNNFIIYRNVFIHATQKANLYLPYPAEYNDVNLYGPIFSILIAPFAILPVALGAVCWVLANVTFLYYALSKLPLGDKYKNALVILCAHEMMNHSSWLQTNAFVCGCIVLGFVFTNQKKDIWALFFIMLATFTKIYGIAGLVFFLFSSKKPQFILWAVIWSGVFFVAPLLITDHTFLINSYHDWYLALQLKSAKNIDLSHQYYLQDISVMGMIRRIFFNKLDNAFVLWTGGVLMLSQFVYFRYYSDLRYRLYVLCSVLIFTVIFSTGSESPTYIIALPGVVIWYILQQKTKALNTFFVFALLLTSFSYSDLFTPYFRKYIVMPYSLKALAPTIVWIIILVQVHLKQFLKLPGLFYLLVNKKDYVSG